MRIEEARAVEMIRDRAVVVPRRSGAQPQHADNRAEGGETGKQAAAGEQRHDFTRHASSVRNGPNAFSTRCKYQPIVQGCESNVFAVGQFKVGRIINGELMPASKHHDRPLVRQIIEVDWESEQLSEQFIRVRIGYAPSTLANQAHISNLEPPVEWDDGSVDFEPIPCHIGADILFVLEEPTADDRCIQNKRHGYLRPSSRQARISSIVARPVCLRSSLTRAIARKASSRLLSAWGLRSAMGLP